MWSGKEWKCLLDGHVSSTFMYRDNEYSYCVRCGRIGIAHADGTGITGNESSNQPAEVNADMRRMVNVSK